MNTSVIGNVYLAGCLIFPSAAFGGQSSGGGGPSIALIGQDSPANTFDSIITRPELGLSIPSLGLPTRSALLEDYRRANARLSVWPQASLKVDGALRDVKLLDGGIVDEQESIQVLPDLTESQP